jgi:hypothetical protein
MTLEIQVLTWDRHKSVVGLNIYIHTHVFIKIFYCRLLFQKLFHHQWRI